MLSIAALFVAAVFAFLLAAGLWGLFAVVLPNKNGVVRFFGWMILLAIPLLILFVVFFTRDNISHEYSVATRERPMPMVSSQGFAESNANVHGAGESITGIKMPLSWGEEAEQRFTADVYPSPESAGRFLGRELSKFVNAQVSKDATFVDDLSIVILHDHVSIESSEFPSDVETRHMIDSITSTLKESYPQADVRSGSHQDSISGSEKVTVDLTYALTQSGNQTGADFTMQMVSQSASDVKAVSMVDKAWVESTENPIRAKDGTTLVVIRSGEFATDARSARELTKLAADQYQLGYGDKSAFQRGIASGELVRDRLTQRLETSQGYVWRDAMLIDATPQRLAELDQRLAVADQRAEQQRRMETAGTISTIAGRVAAVLIILTCAGILYAILNYLTGGYYQLKIGMLIGTAIVVAMLVVAFLFLGTSVRIESNPTIVPVEVPASA